jgi:hypothetical protein
VDCGEDFSTARVGAGQFPRYRPDVSLQPRPTAAHVRLGCRDTRTVPAPGPSPDHVARSGGNRCALRDRSRLQRVDSHAPAGDEPSNAFPGAAGGEHSRSGYLDSGDFEDPVRSGHSAHAILAAGAGRGRH